MTAQTLGLSLAVVAANLLVVFHGFMVPWRKNKEGIGVHLFIFHLVIMIVLNHVVIQSIFPGYPGRQTVRMVLNWAVAGILWWRLIIVARVQIRERRRVKR